MEDRASLAIREACRSLRRRHLAEEGAHGPAFSALSARFNSNSQSAELQSKVDSLQQELMQSYRAHAQVSEHLVEEVQSAQSLKTQLAKEEGQVAHLQSQVADYQTNLAKCQSELEEKIRAVDIADNERLSLRKRVEELEQELSTTVADNKYLVDRWMLLKMQESERMNEANAMYADMLERQKAGRLQELARQQVDGIVRNAELGADRYVESGLMPSRVRYTLTAHEGSCTALLFEHNGPTLISGGSDKLIKVWDAIGGTAINTLRGCLASVLDLSISSDNKHLLSACSDHKLFLWDLHTSRIRHTLTGHTDKVAAVDFNKTNNSRAISAAYDRTIKLWDLQKGYGVTTLICHSNCNSLCLTLDGGAICSGHLDGNLRFWDIRSGKMTNEVVAHNNGITSVSLSRSGHTLLTTGRDNINYVFDVRTLEVRASFRAQGFRVGTNWSRSCMSPDENYVAAGSADGTMFLWTIKSRIPETALKAHSTSTLCCAWSGLGKPLATADKSGTICVWE